LIDGQFAGLFWSRRNPGFERSGWSRASQKGSHITLTKSGAVVVLTVPLYRELGPGLLRSLIRKAEMTVDEFVDLLKRKKAH
jgi:predicted RNA binding protein YcfA (HicA-like mRNA interferase family)